MVMATARRHLGYYPFDFHKECSWNRWDRLSLLMDSIRQDHQVYGAFMAKRQGEVVQIESFQQGVFRTNCIDCLDRSNVVQSMIARETLNLQLQQLQVLEQTEGVINHPRLKRLLDQIWADNADILSIQYGGSPALKTDFTRTGKRTMAGRFADLRHSILRYYMNNLADGCVPQPPANPATTACPQACLPFECQFFSQCTRSTYWGGLGDPTDTVKMRSISSWGTTRCSTTRGWRWRLPSRNAGAL
jgi:hypothetical protein